MSSFLRLILCIFCVCVSAVICASNVEHSSQLTEKPPVRNITKRFDIDVQTCMENFDIQKDKIIRTEDSRAMGAKYINEIDVGSRQECLRMCCETNTCDVFVFEEKNPGSCYMFHCGSPDDFKCRFTKHHNYTSAVLAISRQLNELEDQIRLTKHEQELNQLRKPDAAPSDPNTPAPVVPATSSAVITPAAVKEAAQVPQPANNTAAQGSGRTCSRYQFECRSSGECIAIYNACDGIPQCVDGSDEAPELDCPSPAVTTQSPVIAGPPTPPPPVEAVPFEAPGRQPQQQQQQPLVPAQTAPQRSPAAVPQYRPPVSNWNQQQQPAQNVPQYPAPGIDAAQPAVRSGKPYGREGEGPIPGPNYNMPSSLQWSGYPQQPPRQPLQPQQAPAVQQHPQQANYRGQFQGIANHEYEDQNSHIFTHKGNGLVADSDSPAGQYSEQYNKYGNPAAVNGYYNNAAYRPPAQNNWQLPPSPQQQQSNQPMTHDLHGLEDMPRQQKLPLPDNSYNGPPIPPDYYYEDSQEARYHPPPAHEQELVHHAGIPHGERESIADGATPIQVKHPPPHQHHHKSAAAVSVSGDKQEEHKGSIEVHVKEPEHTTTVKPTAQKTTHHTAHHKKQHPMPEITMEETSVVIEPVDGEVGRPSGAILSLSLGLCITVFMVILVVCRLRLVRRRLRRGKSPYAHDADYLVNGMYL